MMQIIECAISQKLTARAYKRGRNAALLLRPCLLIHDPVFLKMILGLPNPVFAHYHKQWMAGWNAGQSEAARIEHTIRTTETFSGY